jgi:hypothetical protein
LSLFDVKTGSHRFERSWVPLRAEYLQVAVTTRKGSSRGAESSRWKKIEEGAGGRENQELES